MADNMGILAKRKIEANIIKPIYETLKDEIGLENAQNIIKKAIAKSAIESGKEMANLNGGKGDLQSFKSIMPLWLKDDALTIEIEKDDEQDFHYKVTRCRYAECYKALGLDEIGFLLSCNRDAKFIEGYAPDIEFSRTQTIMEGASFCDFKYHRKSCE